VLITNDVDEGILLADRIVPLSAGPRATLGPSVRVDLDRPRDRKAINHCPQFKQIRQAIYGYLLGDAGRKRAAQAADEIGDGQPAHKSLPELKPADLSRCRRFAWGGGGRVTTCAS